MLTFSNLNQNHVIEDHADGWYMTGNITIEDHGDRYHVTNITVI